MTVPEGLGEAAGGCVILIMYFTFKLTGRLHDAPLREPEGWYHVKTSYDRRIRRFDTQKTWLLGSAFTVGTSTHQDAVEGGRRASSLDVTQDGHASVEAQAFDNELVVRGLGHNSKRLSKCLMIDG